MFAAGYAVEVLDADSSESGDFFIGENLLTRFDGDHSLTAIHTVDPNFYWYPKCVKSQIYCPTMIQRPIFFVQ